MSHDPVKFFKSFTSIVTFLRQQFTLKLFNYQTQIASISGINIISISIYIYIYIRPKIKPNSVRIRFLSCQICVLSSTEFELTPFMHCSTIRLALRPAPQTIRLHPLLKTRSFNNRSVTLSRKANLEIDIRHVYKRVQMVHICLIL